MVAALLAMALVAPPLPELHAVLVARGSSGNPGRFVDDRRLPERIPLAFQFWVVREADRVVLIDTGFTRETHARSWPIEDLREPSAGLAELGIAPASVTDVFLTHHHWDHAGGLTTFSTPRLWMTHATLRELRRWAAANHPKTHAVLDAAASEGRLTLFASPTAITPSLTAIPAGMHTQGFAYAELRRGDALWVVASDLIPLHLNLERDRPTGMTSAPQETLRLQRRLLARVDGRIERILTGHEPSLFARGSVLSFP